MGSKALTFQPSRVFYPLESCLVKRLTMSPPSPLLVADLLQSLQPLNQLSLQQLNQPSLLLVSQPSPQLPNLRSQRLLSRHQLPTPLTRKWSPHLSVPLRPGVAALGK